MNWQVAGSILWAGSSPYDSAVIAYITYQTLSPVLAVTHILRDSLPIVTKL